MGYFCDEEAMKNTSHPQSSPLDYEFSYYLQNHKELAKQYEGRIIVLKNHKVIGDFDSKVEAVDEISKTHELGTFLVQYCSSDLKKHISYYRSRLIFPSE